MTTRIALINQKGGVGKTTLCANLGACWARAGRRVLAIDLDPQAHLSLHFDVAADGPSVYDVLRGDRSLADVIVRAGDDAVDLVPASLDLSAAEIEFGQELGREMLLRDQLDQLMQEDPYDIVIVDCPPSLGLLSINALTAVNDVVIPVQAEFLALQGLAQLIDVTERVRSRLHPGLQWRAIIPTMVDSRTILAREVIADLREHFPGKVTDLAIPKRVKIAEAPSRGQSIFGYAPDSKSARDFEKLAAELEERLRIPAPGPAADETPSSPDRLGSAAG